MLFIFVVGQCAASFQPNVHRAQQYSSWSMKTAVKTSFISRCSVQSAFVKDGESIMESCFPSLVVLGINLFASKEITTNLSIRMGTLAFPDCCRRGGVLFTPLDGISISEETAGSSRRRADFSQTTTFIP